MKRPSLPAFRAVLNRYHGKDLRISSKGCFVVLQQLHVDTDSYYHLETLYEASTLSEAHSIATVLQRWLDVINRCKKIPVN